MLHFFRTYQRYVFILITVVIVISFSFFGTYSALERSPFEDPTAFTAIDGSSIKRSELEKMSLFIGSDLEEKRVSGGMGGANFLNDGVMKSNLFESGIAQILLKAFSPFLKEEFVQRHSKEKLYQPYVHPQANFIGTEAAWNYFVPDMQQNYALLSKAEDPLAPEAIAARVNLFLAQSRLPGPMLRNVLRMQEKQYQWLEHDPNLDYIDFSLYGYHRAEDWFGPSFMRLASEFIINSAIIAKERGYVVSESEAYADLLRNAAVSFKQNQKSPYLNVGTVAQYVEEQLRRMGMDAPQAARLWQQVLLFRRLYQDLGNSLLIDPFTFREYDSYPFQSVSGTLYQLPQELHLNTPLSLVKLQLYLKAIDQAPHSKDPLALPTLFKSVQEMVKSQPKLVQKRYLLDITQTSTKQLVSMVGLKQLWDWESNATNWKALGKEFPELALVKAATAEERQQALDSLDHSTRTRVDNAARLAIVKEHPEWVTQALDQALPQTRLVNIPLLGGKSPLEGVGDRKALLAELDKAPLVREDKQALPLEYSGDKQHYYRIRVLERSSTPEIMTYAEANQSGVLDELANSTLTKQYEELRSAHPEEYQNKDGNWKSFDSVADSVIGRLYNPLVKAMSERFVGGLIPQNDAKNLSISRAASLRFLQYMTQAKISMQNETTQEATLVKTESTPPDREFPARLPLADQWKLIAKPYTTTRGSQDSTLDKQEAMAMKKGDWSKIYTPANGDLYFFTATSHGSDIDQEKLSQQIYGMQHLVAYEAQRSLTENLLALMQKRKALNIDFLTKKEVSSEGNN